MYKNLKIVLALLLLGILSDVQATIGDQRNILIIPIHFSDEKPVYNLAAINNLFFSKQTTNSGIHHKPSVNLSGGLYKIQGQVSPIIDVGFSVDDFNSSDMETIYNAVFAKLNAAGINPNNFDSKTFLIPIKTDSSSLEAKNSEEQEYYLYENLVPNFSHGIHRIKAGSSLLDPNTGIKLDFLDPNNRETTRIRTTNYRKVNLNIDHINNLFDNDIITTKNNKIMSLRLTNNSKRNIVLNDLQFALQFATNIKPVVNLTTTVFGLTYISSARTSSDFNTYTIPLNNYILTKGSQLELPINLLDPNNLIPDGATFRVVLSQINSIDKRGIYPQLVINNNVNNPISSISSPALIYRTSSSNTTSSSDAAVDLSVTLSSSMKPSYNESSNLASITMQINNNPIAGSSTINTAYNVVATMPLPLDSIELNGFLTSGCTISNNVLECKWSQMTGGASYSKTFHFKTKQINALRQNVQIGPVNVVVNGDPKRPRNVDINTSNNKSNSINFEIIKQQANPLPIDLSVTLSSSSLQPSYNEDSRIATIAMLVTNNLISGSSTSNTAYNVVATLPLPVDSIELDSSLTSGCLINNNLLQCQWSQISAGASSTKTFYFKTKQISGLKKTVNIGPAEIIANSDPSKGLNIDSNTSNNKSNTLSFDITKKQIDLSIVDITVKNATGSAVNPDSITVGANQELSFGIRYANNQIPGLTSVNQAPNTYIEFKVPAEFIFTSHINTFDGTNYCTLGSDSIASCRLGDLSSSTSVRSISNLFKLQAKTLTVDTKINFGPLKIVSKPLNTIPTLAESNETNNFSKSIAINITGSIPTPSTESDLTVSIEPLKTSYEIQTPLEVKLKTSNISDIGTGATAYGVKTMLVVPANFVLIPSLTSSSFCSQSSNLITCKTSSLSPGSKSVTLMFDTLPIAGLEGSQAVVVGPASVELLNENASKISKDPNLSNNSALGVNTTIIKPNPGTYQRKIDLYGTLSTTSTSVKPGETVSLNLTVYNESKSDLANQSTNIAYNVVAEMIVPAEFELVLRPEDTDISYDSSRRVISWKFNPIRPDHARGSIISLKAQNPGKVTTVKLGAIKISSAATDINQAAKDINETNNITTTVDILISPDTPNPMTVLDTNHDGGISISEAILGRLSLLAGNKSFDLNLDGLVDSKDLVVLDALANTIGNYKMALNIMPIIDTNSDNQVSQNESILVQIQSNAGLIANDLKYDVDKNSATTVDDINAIVEGLKTFNVYHSAKALINIVDKDQNLIISMEEANNSKADLAKAKTDSANFPDLVLIYDFNSDQIVNETDEAIINPVYLQAL